MQRHIFIGLIALLTLCKNGRAGFTVTQCEGFDAQLTCEPDYYIQVTSAFYGRADTSTCSSAQPHGKTVFTKCKSDCSQSIISDRCNGLSKCSVPVTSEVLSEPCPGTYKYLTVSFMCLKARRSLTCQNMYNLISCDWPSTLLILHANYGRRDEEICPSGNTTTTDCVSDVTKEVKDWCRPWGNRCYVIATNFLYSDPCYDYYKYLEVVYMCLNHDGTGGMMGRMHSAG